jgi:serine/threonine protein kinase/predicted ATPase/DNA-binding SARP family transcriptional activator
MALQIYLFGTPHCRRKGQPITIHRRKALALLAYLAASGRPHSRDALATLFWPEYDQSGARANLRRDLSYLKQALGDGQVEITRADVCLIPGAGWRLDTVEFTNRLAQVESHDHPPAQLCPTCRTALAEAVDLYSGDFMTGFTLPDCAEFDEWQFFLREGLRQCLASALQQLIDWSAAQRMYGQGAEYGRRWLALDPLNEPAHRRLMQLYAWDDQRAAALRQYEECVRLLDEELGVVPEAETVALYEAIKARQLSLPAVNFITPQQAAVTEPHLRYRQDELLSVGGHGELYYGVDLVTGAPVVIKRLRPELIKQSLEFISRFQREGEALHRLNHPNIVRMLTSFEQDDQYCLVMEYVPGGSLRTLLDQESALPADRVVAIGLELADALSRAHHLGIIHRDLKPENVLLAADGTPRLSDFGLARLEGADVRLTRTGAILGSPAYMSPEALQGEELDARSDVWSLGVLLYEMLAGERPFKGEQITAVMISILNDEAPDITRLQPAVPLPLSDLLQHMLVKDRDGRFDSMRRVAAELEAIRAGKGGRGAGESTSSGEGRARATPQPSYLHNLPNRSTPFIGREQELADVSTLLAQSETRLLTIAGPGGIGKTRLALAAAAGMEGFVHGVCFVPLAPLKSAEHIPYALAENLDFHFSGAEEPGQQLLNYLRRKQMLLVMDNFEHLLNGAPFLIEIVEAAPEVKVLVTSRERLNLSGETVFLLAGMNYPDQQRMTETEPTTYGAVQLLWQRARLVRADFAPDREELVHAVRICQLVDGMPLALVLAAGWLELLSLKEIAAEISRSLDFLETEMRDLPERQRSIRVVFYSSWQRLTVEEQQVFAKLSVFRGGFTRQAAQAVTGAGLRTLRMLVNKSLVSARPDGRYDVHELLRQYAEEQLPLCAGEEDVYAGHSTYYLDALHRLEDDLKGRRQLEALNEIDSDFENVRAAWEWALQHKDEAAIDRALESLHLFSDMRHRQQDGAALFLLARDHLAPAPDEPPSLTWGRILTRGAFLRLILSATHWPDSGPDLEQALAIARRHKNQAEIGLTSMALGAFTEMARADSAQAISLLEQSLACYQAIADPFYQSRTFGWLARCHFDVSGIDRYYELLREELALARRVGSLVDIAVTLTNLTDAAIALGNYLAAERYIQEATLGAGEVGAHGITAYGRGLQAFLAFLVRGDINRSRALLQAGRKIAANLNYEVAIAYALAISSIMNGTEPEKCAEARQQAEESLAMPVNNGLGIILARWGLVIALCGLDNDEAAWRALQAAIRQARDFKSQAILTWLLPVAALLLARQQQKERAVELLALAAAHPLSPSGWQAQWPSLVEMRTTLEQELGPELFQTAWERGTTAELDPAVQWITEAGHNWGKVG